MKALHRLVVVFVVLTPIAWARCARAAVDVTGRWDVTMQSQFFGPQTGEWDFAQLGSQITVVQRWASTNPFLEVFPLRGTTDPDSGVFSFDIGANQPCRDTRIGARASDGLEEIDLRAKDPFHGTLKVKAKGPDLHLPASLAGIVAPVVAELRGHNASHDQCWPSSFSADATQRSAQALKARN
jgi:hypothetical protein